MREGVTYEISCESYNHIYVGETADNAPDRGKRHAYSLEKKYEPNALYKHVVFKIRVAGIFGNRGQPHKKHQL